MTRLSKYLLFVVAISLIAIITILVFNAIWFMSVLIAFGVVTIYKSLLFKSYSTCWFGIMILSMSAFIYLYYLNIFTNKDMPIMMAISVIPSIILWLITFKVNYVKLAIYSITPLVFLLFTYSILNIWWTILVTIAVSIVQLLIVKGLNALRRDYG